MAGRPKLEFDWELFDKLCGLQCTKREIAEVMELSEDTIDRRCITERGVNFAVHWDQKASIGRVSLRRKQFEIAMGGNIVMLIWLGKQLLGQSDKLDSNHRLQAEIGEKVQALEKLSREEQIQLLEENLKVLKADQ